MPTYAGRYRKRPALVAFGDAARRVRTAGRISHEGLACRAENDRAHVGNIERGYQRFAPPSILLQANPDSNNAPYSTRIGNST